MSVTTIITTLITLINTLPKVVDLVDRFYNHWITYKLKQIKDNQDEIEKERTALVIAISKAETNESRKALSIVLSKLDRL